MPSVPSREGKVPAPPEAISVPVNSAVKLGPGAAVYTIALSAADAAARANAENPSGTANELD